MMKRVILAALALVFIVLAVDTVKVNSSSAKNDAKDLYIKHCSKCHRKDGSGIRGVYPPLKNADYIRNNSISELLRGMLFGRSGKIVVNGVSYNGVMTTEIDKSLTDAEIADILNFVLNEFNSMPSKSSAEDVKAARKAGKLK